MIIHWLIYRARREGRSAVGFASKGALFPRQVRIALLAPLLMIASSVGCGPPRPASISSVEVSAVSDPPPRSDAELVALSEAVLRAAAEMSAAAAAINAAAASLRQSSVAEDVAEPTLPADLDQQSVRTRAARSQQAFLYEQMQLAKSAPERIIVVAEFLAAETAIAKLSQGQELAPQDALTLARLDDRQRLRLRAAGITDDTIERVQSKVAESISRAIEGLIRDTNALGAAEVTNVVQKLRSALFDDAERDLTPGLPPSD